MLIRSQDKKSLCNYNSGIVTAFEKYDYDIINNRMVPTEIKGCNIFFCDQSREIQIGTYSTEEKAIKVLDMIQKEYGGHYYGEGGPLTTMNHYVEPFAFIPPKVFQMPSDEEVEV